VRAPALPSEIHQVPLVSFQFFMPDFAGYTTQTYDKEFQENRVDVIELQPADPRQTAPGASGSYPPNMLKRLLRGLLKPNDYEDRYGLRCYRWISGSHATCYGRRDEMGEEDIILDMDVPPYSPATRFPLMQAEYFSGRYGGVRIFWRTHVKKFSHWHVIDSQIWKFVDSWNIAHAGNATVKPR
jgi:hypothetical protein